MTDQKDKQAMSQSPAGSVGPAATGEADNPRAAGAGSSSGLERAVDRLEARRQAKSSQRDEGQLKGQRARGKAEALIARVLSGAIYSLGTLAFIFWGQVPLAVLVSAMAWACCSEFYRMARLSGRMPNEVMGLAVAVLFPLVPLTNRMVGCVVILFLFLVVLAGWYVVTPRANVSDVAITIFGPLYTSLLYTSLVCIRMVDPGTEGALLTFGVIGSIWLNDAAAYFVGSRFGRHKLAPRISPKKSVEGLVGGLMGCLLIWVAIWALGVRDIPLPLALLCGFLVGVFSVMGDLFESRIKRGVGVKDSGDIMPGHGGLLDRSDSLLFGVSTAFFILYLGGIL